MEKITGKNNEIIKGVKKLFTSSKAVSYTHLKTIADLVGKDIQTAITNGIVDSTKLVVESGVAVDMIKAAVSSIDYRALAKGVSDSDNAVLTLSLIHI